MRRTLALVLIVGTLALLSGLRVGVLPAAADTPGTTLCTGMLPAGTYGNITVPAGATCTISSGTTISGTLVAFAGSTLIVQRNVAIAGNLLDQSGAQLVLNPGDVIGGNLSVSGLQRGGAVCGTTIQGNVVVQDAVLTENFFFGAFGPQFCPGNTVGGNGTFRNLTAHGPGLIITENQVVGNLSLTNTTTGVTVVSHNQVGNVLSCLGNQPPPQNGSNTARLFVGQCSAAGSF